MKVASVNHYYEWHGDKKMVTDYTSVHYEGSNTVNTSQRWLYEVHIYDKRGKLLKQNHIGKNLDKKV